MLGSAGRGSQPLDLDPCGPRQRVMLGAHAPLVKGILRRRRPHGPTVPGRLADGEFSPALLTRMPPGPDLDRALRSHPPSIHPAISRRASLAEGQLASQHEPKTRIGSPWAPRDRPPRTSAGTSRAWNASEPSSAAGGDVSESRHHQPGEPLRPPSGGPARLDSAHDGVHSAGPRPTNG
jgi:hypothetical protein